MKKFRLIRLSTGYYHLRISSEIWAQWAVTEDGPKRKHCFNPDWSWPVIKLQRIEVMKYIYDA